MDQTRIRTGAENNRLLASLVGRRVKIVLAVVLNTGSSPGAIEGVVETIEGD